MTDSVSLSLDTAAINRDADKLVRQYLTAGTDTIVETTKWLERALEDATRSAVPGRLWRAWKSETYPKRGAARNPVGEVFVNGGKRSQGAITFWTQPGTIRAKGELGGRYLAIPLPAAGSRGRDRTLSPVEWEARHNIELRLVVRPGKPALLVADNAVLSGKARIARGNTAKRIAAGRGNATVPIFVLLPAVSFRNAVAVEPIVRAAEGRLVGSFLGRIGR